MISSKKHWADGSDITINKSSTLTYPEKFDQAERRVKLEGEAFFEIERDEAHPFIIELPHENYVRVLGTSFNINTTDDNATTTVYVETGKVEFGTIVDTLILLPGEKAIMDNATGEAYKEVDEINEVTTSYWINEEIRFDSDELGDVARILSEIYEIDIKFKCNLAKRELIRHTVSKGEEIDDFFSSLALSHPILKIEKKETNLGVTYILDCNED